jgi:hypothetical protein
MLLMAASGCGSQAKDHADAAGVIRTMHWDLASLKSANVVNLSVPVQYCEYTPKLYIHRVKMVERRHSTIITTLVRFPPKGIQDSEGACLGVELDLQKAISLKQSSARQSLYDGSTSPPQKRWPRFP